MSAVAVFILESQLRGSLISRSSLQSPVKIDDSVSKGLNLIRAEGTDSSSSSVEALSSAAGKQGINCRFTITGSNSSNPKLGSLSDVLTN